MSIFLKQTDPDAPLRVDSPEALVAAIRRCGIIPFFENAIPGYSIEEMTPREYWFDGEEGTLGPWDWKIDAVQTGRSPTANSSAAARPPSPRRSATATC